tara:strand:- start:459 stop:959 length:501 start_codon:yes stop_codon:yes gene_type:complete
MEDIVFWICAVIAGVSSLLVVTNRNPVYSAMALMLCFLSFAVIFLDLGTTFLAVMHILVYTGAILVLFLFVIMLLNLKQEELGKEYNPGMKLVLALLCCTLFGVLIESFGRSPLLKGDLPAAPAGFGSIDEVGMALFTKFALPFELVSILLIIAILGAVVLAKKKL